MNEMLQRLFDLVEIFNTKLQSKVVSVTAIAEKQSHYQTYLTATARAISSSILSVDSASTLFKQFRNFSATTCT